MRRYFVLVLGITAAILASADSPRKPDGSDSGGIICDLIDPSGTDSLNPAQRTAVQQAIDNIRTPPPGAIGYQMASGSHRTASCGEIADDLQKQLNSGRIRVDTVNTDFDGTTLQDGQTSTDGDQLNLRAGFIDSVAAGLIPGVHLEEILVHERKHKQQKAEDEWNKEIPACSSEKSYKDSCHVDSTNRWYKLCAEALKDAIWARDGEKEVRNIRPIAAQGHEHFLICDTARGPAAMDIYTTFPFGEGAWNQFPFLPPMRASDHLLFEDHPSIPPGCVRSLICGGLPELGVARIMALRVCDGQVTMIEAVRDFGPPIHPPMFFFAMDRNKSSGRFLVLDTLNKQILNMEDFDEDWIPDEVGAIYANAFWPGFEGLLAARGIDIRAHLFLGVGAMVNFFDAHLPHVYTPNDSVLFLPDADGDLMADACVPMRLYEFTAYWPAICVPPWEGDAQVTLLASWTHEIEVWTSDSLGQTLFDPLAAGTMTSGGNQTFPLSRPVLAGEYLVARDLTWDWQLKLATMVIDPQPESPTIAVEGETLFLRWDPVRGADHYCLYASSDCEQFFDTGLMAETNELFMPFDPALPVQFFRVTAMREE